MQTCAETSLHLYISVLAVRFIHIRTPRRRGEFLITCQHIEAGPIIFCVRIFRQNATQKLKKKVAKTRKYIHTNLSI